MYNYTNRYDAERCGTIATASCKFVEDICGNLNVHLKEYEIIKSDHETYWEERLVTKDNMKLKIIISYERYAGAYICECLEYE